jgi:DNA modification methylase
MLQQVYDFEHHVKIGEHIDAMGKLPVTFMLLQPPSWSDEVWTDVTRMMTLNASQAQKGLQVHLCPMQFDIADRAITQWTNPGETVFDPFGGLMTVPYRAVKLGRKGVGVELSPAYYADGVNYCKAAENELSMPSLFDLMDDGEMLDQAA